MEGLTALSGEPEFAAEKRSRRSRAQTSDDPRTDKVDLSFQPRTAGFDFSDRWFFVDSAFAAVLKFEMFYGIRNVNGFSLDSGVFESAIEQPAGGSHKRPAGEVLLVTRLLADEN